MFSEKIPVRDLPILRFYELLSPARRKTPSWATPHTLFFCRRAGRLSKERIGRKWREHRRPFARRITDGRGDGLASTVLSLLPLMWTIERENTRSPRKKRKKVEVEEEEKEEEGKFKFWAAAKQTRTKRREKGGTERESGGSSLLFRCRGRLSPNAGEMMFPRLSGENN